MKKKSDENKLEKPITIKFYRNTLSKIDEYAKYRGWSRSLVIRELLEKTLKNPLKEILGER